MSTYECLLRLWDHYFIQRDPIFYIMIALGAILESRDEILQKTSKADVSKFFTHFKFLTEEQVEAVVARAITLSEHAPLSLRKQLQGVVARYDTSKAWIKLNIIGAPCLHVSILDVLRDKKDGRIIFFVDCRSEEELAQGMLPTAYPLPINDLLSSTPAVFKEAIQRVKALQDETPELHFCLYGRGGHSPKSSGTAELTAVVYKLMRENFKHVSLIQNGYLGIHNFAMDGRVELTGHVRDSCPICLKHMSPIAKGFASMRGTFSKISHNRNVEVIKSRATNAMTLIKQSIQREEEKRRAAKRAGVGAGAAGASGTAGVGSGSEVKVIEVPPLPEPSQKEGLFTIGDEDDDDVDAVGKKRAEKKKREQKAAKKKPAEEKRDDSEQQKPSSEDPKEQQPKQTEEEEVEEEKKPSEVPKEPEKSEQVPEEPKKEQSPKPEKPEEPKGKKEEEDDTVDFGEDMDNDDGDKGKNANEGEKTKEPEMNMEEKKEEKDSNVAATTITTTKAAKNDDDDDDDDVDFEDEDEEEEDEEEDVKVEEPEGYSTIQSWMMQCSLWEVTPENGADKWFVTVNDKEMTLLERHPKIFSYVRVVKAVPVKDIVNAAEDKATNGAVVTLADGTQEKLVMDDGQEFVKAVKIALENKAM